MLLLTPGTDGGLVPQGLLPSLRGTFLSFRDCTNTQWLSQTLCRLWKHIPVRLEGPLQLFTSSPRHGGKTRVPRAVRSCSHSGTCFTVAAAWEALEFRSSSGDISFLSSGHFQGCDPGVLPGASTESAPHGLTLTSRVPQLSALNHILRGLS